MTASSRQRAAAAPFCPVRCPTPQSRSAAQPPNSPSPPPEAGRIGRAHRPSIPGVELAEMPATACIIHLDGVVQTVALDDAAIRRLPPTPAASAGPWRLRPDLLRIREAGKGVACRKRAPDSAASGHLRPLHCLVLRASAAQP